MSGRRIALVCLTPDTDANETPELYLPSYGIKRIHAALLADPDLAGATVQLIEKRSYDVEPFVAALAQFEPDLIGFSAYVWSAPTLIEVARRYKGGWPEACVVFGGPSARTSYFDLAPQAPAGEYLDAVVSTDGEHTFAEIAKLPELSRAGLASIAGLHLPEPQGWTNTRERTLTKSLDELPSPFQMGLMPDRCVGYLESFRGCPLSCRFCEWGVREDYRSVFSDQYIARELELFKAHKIEHCYLLDAGLNLNQKAFRNLRDAERQAGFFKNANLWGEVYPSHLTDEHIDFLKGVAGRFMAIGFQSLDPAVIKGMDRPWSLNKIDTCVHQLAHVCHTLDIQIVMGLPGDSPAGFKRTLEYARSLPAQVRAYYCLVLPDALLTRSRPEWNVEFDPVTLELRSCQGWSADELRETRAWIEGEARAAGGRVGNYWYMFPRRDARTTGS